MAFLMTKNAPSFKSGFRYKKERHQNLDGALFY
jgi:hypothetical protein